MAATAKGNVEVAETLYDAFNRGDLDEVIAGMADDITWVEPDGDALARGTHHGPAAVMKNVFAPMEAAYEEFEVVPKRYIDAGDIVVAEGLMSGTTMVGTSFEIPFAHICELHDGKLRKFTNYTDTAVWQQAFEG
jgi:ketosteroid isomerase-like protein